MVGGGAEPPSVTGHLSGGEPIVKPTLKGRFLFLCKGMVAEEG